MGILGENGYENLRMMDHSTEMFWDMCFRTPDDFDDENVEA